MKKLSLLNKFLFIINSISLTLLLLAYLSPFINPNLIWPISFLGLIFPLLYITNLIFLIYWFILIKKQIWANIIILLIGIQYMDDFIAFHSYEKSNKKTIKIMTYNVRLFNLYNWIPELNKQNIVDFLNREDNDILCIQEFYTKDNFPQMTYKYNHISMQKKTNPGYMAIYSKYPQINKSTIKVDGKAMNNTCIYSDIIINNDTVRIYNIHLASNWFKKTDYNLIRKPNKKTIKKDLKGIIYRMKQSYKIRADEALIIKEHMQNSPFPIIVCGDLNDTPLSFSYNKIKGDLTDSFKKYSHGIGQSFIEIPALRIDYILHDKKFNSLNYYKKKKILSDHYAIVAEIEL